MAKNRRILVTGVARWWGALLVQRLVEEPDVAEVIGIDTSEPHYDLDPAGFLKLDIRYSLVGKLVRAVGIDTVVHTATTIDSFDPDRRRAHETNVIGTLNLLAACAGIDSPVRRLVLKSSGHVYGSSYDVPSYVTEDRRLDADSPHSFVRDIVEVESYVFDYALRNQGVEALVLRLANSLSPVEPAPLARYLDLDFVPTIMGYDPIVQLIHRDDVIEAFVRATMTGPAGAYNIAGDNPAPLSLLLNAAGKVHAPMLPPLGLGVTSQFLRRLGITFLTPQLLDLLRFGRTLSTEKAARELRFRAARDTLGAFEDYIQQRRVIRFMPDQRTYTYEKELEDFIRSRREGMPELRAVPGAENSEGQEEKGREPVSAGASRPRRRRR